MNMKSKILFFMSITVVLFSVMSCGRIDEITDTESHLASEVKDESTNASLTSRPGNPNDYQYQYSTTGINFYQNLKIQVGDGGSLHYNLTVIPPDRFVAHKDNTVQLIFDIVGLDGIGEVDLFVEHIDGEEDGYLSFNPTDVGEFTIERTLNKPAGDYRLHVGYRENTDISYTEDNAVHYYFTVESEE